jgi:hypothetical protein
MMARQEPHHPVKQAQERSGSGSLKLWSSSQLRKGIVCMQCYQSAQTICYTSGKLNMGRMNKKDDYYHRKITEHSGLGYGSKLNISSAPLIA